MGGIHWRSIPSIDNLDIPSYIIDACRKKYETLGKYKIYEVLNDELNHSRFAWFKKELEYKKIPLIKRYLYLYRIAMAQTMSFAYNIDEYELKSGKGKFADKNQEDYTICPDCGKPLTLLPQFGQLRGYPLTHYKDVVESYNLPVTYEQLIVPTYLKKSFKDYISTRSHGDVIDYTFLRWTVNSDGSDMGSSYEDSVLNFIDPETKTLTVYAVFVNNTSGVVLDSSKYVINEFVLEITNSDILYKQPEAIRENYKFSHWTLSREEDRYSGMTQEELSNVPIWETEGDHKGEVLYFAIFNGLLLDGGIIVPIGTTVRIAANSYFPSPSKENYIFDSFTYNEKKIESLYRTEIEEGVYEETKLSSIISDDHITLKATYKYDVPPLTYCYDDTCYFCKQGCESERVGIKYFPKYINKLNPGLPLNCPICNNRTLYRGYPSTGGTLIKDGRLKILRYNEIEVAVPLWEREDTVYADRQASLVSIGTGEYKYDEDGNKIQATLRVVQPDNSVVWEPLWDKPTIGYEWQEVDPVKRETFGYIYEVASLNSLLECNGMIGIEDGTFSIDMYKYADASKSTYKIYVYDHTRDGNFDQNMIDGFEDDYWRESDGGDGTYINPEEVQVKWVVINPDSELIPVDVDGSKKNYYMITNVTKVFEMLDGSIRTIEKDNITIFELSYRFQVSSAVTNEITQEDGRYVCKSTCLLSGYSITGDNAKTLYDDSDYRLVTLTKSIPVTFSKDKTTIYPNGNTMTVPIWDSNWKSYIGWIRKFEDGSEFIISPDYLRTISDFDSPIGKEESEAKHWDVKFIGNIITWTGDHVEYIDHSTGERYIGGYPTTESVKESIIIGSGENQRKEFALKPFIKERYAETFREKTVTINGIVVSNGLEATEGLGTLESVDGISESDSLVQTSHVLSDEDGNIIEDPNYSGPNYEGWKWLGEDQAYYYSINKHENGADSLDSNIVLKRAIKNNYAYSILLSQLIDEYLSTTGEPNIKPPSRKTASGSETEYKFAYYSKDGFKRISNSTLAQETVVAGDVVQLYIVYKNIHTVKGTGLVERDAAIVEEHIKNEFSRVMFPDQFNDSGGVVSICENTSCWRYCNILNKRKWTYQDLGSNVKNTTTGRSISKFPLDYAKFDSMTIKLTDKFIFRWPQTTDIATYMLHLLGSGSPDIYRFDFEYKYATDEWNANKGNLPSTLTKDNLLQNVLKNIRWTNIQPIYDRPLKEYNNRYKDELFNTFKFIYVNMVRFTPWSILSNEEIETMTEILNSFDYEYKLKIIAFMNMWNHYVNYSVKEWEKESYPKIIDKLNAIINRIVSDDIITSVAGVKSSKKNVVTNALSADYTHAYRVKLAPASGYMTVLTKIEDKLGLKPYVIIKETEDVEDLRAYYPTEIPEDYTDTAVSTTWKFIYWTTNEEGLPMTDSAFDKNVVKGESITWYPHYEDVIKIYVDTYMTDDSFATIENFVRDFYTEGEFYDLSRKALSFYYDFDNTGESKPGVTKDWFMREYDSASSFINSFNDVEFSKFVNSYVADEYIEYSKTNGNEILSYDMFIKTIEVDNPELITDIMDEKGKTVLKKFKYWSVNGYEPISEWWLEQKITGRETVNLYRVYEDLSIEKGDYSKDWYIGETAIVQSIKESLSNFHEELMLPSEFMLYMFGVMIWPKNFITMTDSKGAVGSYLTSSSTSIPSTSSNDALAHRPQDTDNYFNIAFATISNRFTAAYDSENESTLFEQFYVISNKEGNKFKVYSFMKGYWIDDFYGDESAYDYCLLLKNTENPCTSDGKTHDLINMYAYETNANDSYLLLIYDTGIGIFDFYNNVWKSYLPIEDIDEGFKIKSVTISTYKHVVYLLTASNSIFTYDYINGVLLKNNNNECILYVPKEEEQDETEEETEEELIFTPAPVTKTESDDSVSEVKELKAILASKVGNLIPYTLKEGEYPYVLRNERDESPIYPMGITEAYYITLNSQQREKYHVNPKLTIGYALDQIDLTELEAGIEETKYVTSNTGETASYTYQRLSLHTYGIHISDAERGLVMRNSIGIYAIYYKDGVEIDPNLSFQIYDEDFATRKDAFLDYINESGNGDDGFDSSVHGVVNDQSLPTEIDKIFALEGFDYSENYVPVLACLTGSRLKILRCENGVFSVLNTIDFEDDIDVVDVIALASGRKTYVIYKNQRIAEVSTYLYTPSILQEEKDKNIAIMIGYQNVETQFISYVTEDNGIHHVAVSNKDYVNNRYSGAFIDPKDFVLGNGASLTTYVDSKIEQSVFDFYVPNIFKWEKHLLDDNTIVTRN